MSGLTDRQKEVLSYIGSYAGSHGFPPTLREIALHFSIAPTSVLGHLHALESKGFIRRQPAKSRCLEIVRRSAPLEA